MASLIGCRPSWRSRDPYLARALPGRYLNYNSSSKWVVQHRNEHVYYYLCDVVVVVVTCVLIPYLDSSSHIRASFFFNKKKGQG